MPEPPSARYIKLPGAGLFALGFSRNWLGDDHLLTVSSFLGVEHYKRYYFKDIEALVLRRTAGRLIWNIVFLGTVALFAFLAAMVWQNMTSAVDREARVALTVIMVVLVSGLILLSWGNTFRGRTCAVYIQTSSGLERLSALLRVRTAQLAIGRLRRAVETARAAVESAGPAN